MAVEAFIFPKYGGFCPPEMAVEPFIFPKYGGFCPPEMAVEAGGWKEIFP